MGCIKFLLESLTILANALLLVCVATTFINSFA